MAAAAGGGGGGDRPVGWGWDQWKEGNVNNLLLAPSRAAKKARVEVLIKTKHLPQGVDEKELVKYEHQPTTGDAKLDRLRNGLVDDYNDIAVKRLQIYEKIKFTDTREDIKEVLKLASKAKKMHNEMKSNHRHPHPYPSHFDQAPKLKL